MKEWELKQRMSLPLEQKIFKTVRTIEQFYDENDGNVYISTGGFDSTNLCHIIEKYSNYSILRVCVGQCEGRENLKFNKERGDIILKPSIVKRRGKNYLATKSWVIQEYGYPIFSKEVAMKVSRYLHTKDKKQKEKRLNGYIGNNNKKILNGKIPEYAKFLIYAPFEVSEKCCIYTKEKPLRDYEKENNVYPITGEMVEESLNRRKEYLKHGCIRRNTNIKKCTPQAFWTKQDELKLALKDNYKYSSSYGKIIKVGDKLAHSGEKRTGCENCLFGILYDLDRVKRLKKRDKGSYNYMMMGGKWIRKDLFRYVDFMGNGFLIWSNLYWVPNKKGMGYKFVIDYLNKFECNIKY